MEIMHGARLFTIKPVCKGLRDKKDSAHFAQKEDRTLYFALRLRHLWSLDEYDPWFKLRDSGN